MRTKALFLAVLIVSSLGVFAAPALPSTPASLAPDAIDRENHCSSLDTLAPEHYETPVVGDYTTKVTLEVAVLLVGVDPDVADEIMREVADVYALLGIEVRWVNEVVDLQIDPPPDTSATSPVLSTSESGAYIQASKDHFGGERPWWADVVYTMVDGELSSSVAGQADCVGGIVYPDHAFAVGEVAGDRPVARNAKIAGHEIAHLLAAHHHFANCVEGDKEELLSGLYACTLMFNDVGLISLQFSTLEGAVVRDYALEYAAKTPTVAPPEEEEPPPPPAWQGEDVERDVKLDIDRDRIATGRVIEHSAGDIACSQRVLVHLQRRSSDGWDTVKKGKTNKESLFRFRLRGAGRYRVHAPSHYTGYGVTCLEATSPVRRTS